MKVTVPVKLLPSADEAEALRDELHRCNDGANVVSRAAFDSGVKREYALRGLLYAALRERGIKSAAAQQVIKKTVHAYAALRANIRAGNLGGPGAKRRIKAESKPLAFRADAAQPYDHRSLSWDLAARTVAITTASRRITGIAFACSADQLATLTAYRKGEADLARRDGAWFLYATCDVPEAPVYEPSGFLGVDLGIANIATTSDGAVLAGRGLNRYRRRQAALRTKLQKKGTRSAKRLLRLRRRREARRARDVNHRISKQLVTEAERTSRGISLEDLRGIRGRVRLRKPQRVALHSWAFAQLGGFIVYKARRAGVPVVFVDPTDTSRRCAQCGCVDKRNRVSQALFICRGCGVVAHADRNASRNIAQRGVAVWNAGRRSSVPAIARLGDGQDAAGDPASGRAPAACSGRWPGERDETVALASAGPR